MNRFQQHLLDSRMSRTHKLAMSEVTDTAYSCMLWWESYGGNLPQPTPGDVLAMAEMVLDREQELAQREQGGFGERLPSA